MSRQATSNERKILQLNLSFFCPFFSCSLSVSSQFTFLLSLWNFFLLFHSHTTFRYHLFDIIKSKMYHCCYKLQHLMIVFQIYLLKYLQKNDIRKALNPRRNILDMIWIFDLNAKNSLDPFSGRVLMNIYEPTYIHLLCQFSCYEMVNISKSYRRWW